MKASAAAILAVTAILCVTASATAADWPNFRGPDHNGISPETDINRDWSARPPRTLWTIDLDDKGYAGPAVAGGLLYIVDHDGGKDVVRAVDTKDGSDRWTFSYPDSSQENYGYARATPAVDEGRVYTLSRFGILNCLDAATGRSIWSKQIVEDFDGQAPKYQMSMSPFIDGEKLIVLPGGEGAAVTALDKSTGRTIWTGGGDDKPGYATPVAAVIGGRRQYLAFTGYSLLGVDAADGRLLWRFPWKTRHDVNAATPVVVGERIFISSGYKHGAALVQVGDGEPKTVWESRSLVAHFNSPILSGGYVYGIGDPGDLVCLDPKTGQVQWSEEGFEKGGIVGIDGMIIALAGETGEAVLVEMSPEGYREHGRIRPLGGRSWTAPIVAGGKLYIRNESSLACVDLK